MRKSLKVLLGLALIISASACGGVNADPVRRPAPNPREELRRTNLEAYVQQYGHNEPNGQRMDTATISNFYVPMMTQSVYTTLDPVRCNVSEAIPANYDQLVHHSTKPCLVLFSRNVGGGDEIASRGLASVFRALSVDYGNDVNFFVFNADKYIDGNNQWFRWSDYNKMIAENIQAMPSIVMYAPFDLKRGMQRGRMRQIDILRGGFNRSQDWLVFYNFLESEWIPSNITSPNGTYVYRFDNSSDERKISINR